MASPDFAGELVLVTGGAGFIGSHLVDALVERGAKVRVLDNLATGKRENLAQCMQRIEILEGDIRDLEACKRACQGATYVFHQAALGSVPRSMRDPATTIEVNVAGSANVFAAARDAAVRRVVYASSSSVYGDSKKLPKREGEEGRPLSPYALSKVMNEALADTFGRSFGIEFVGLRYFNVYGPRQDPNGPYAAVVPRFCMAYRGKEPPTIFGDVEQTRDFTFVGDAVRANLLAAGAGAEACGRAFNIAPGRSVSINRLARLLREITGSTVEPRHLDQRPGDVRDSLADPTAASGILGFTASITLEDGLRATVASHGT
jgi:nucleoside-diphosphate-sugar epimerase